MRYDARTWLGEHDPLTIRPFVDCVVDAVGHPATSLYSETYWLPIIGPSGLFVLRRLHPLLLAEYRCIEVRLADLAAEIGLQKGLGHNSAIIKTLARLVDFGLATPRTDYLAVRTMLPPLPLHHLRRLPEHLAHAHSRLTRAAVA